MPLKPFAQVSKREQVRRLRPVAEALCRRFGHPADGLRLLHYGYNTTFRIDDKAGNRYAMRINVNSSKEAEQIKAEVDWVSALAKDGVPVPIPQECDEGFVLTVDDSPTGKPLYAVLYSWLYGSDVGNRLDPPLAERVGKLTADLHCHAASWDGPKVGHIHEFPDWLMLLPWVLDKSAYIDASVFQQSLDKANAVTERLRASAKAHVIHFDLHTSNLRLHKGELSVLDFDDIFMGWPALDAAVTVFHNRRHKDAAAIEEAYWRGLGATPETWGLSQTDFESLVAGRAVLLVNDIFQNNNAEIAKMAKPYGEVMEKRLRHFLNTGTYDPSVAQYQP